VYQINHKKRLVHSCVCESPLFFYALKEAGGQCHKPKTCAGPVFKRSQVRLQINPKLKIDGILLTMADCRTNCAKEIGELVVMKI